MKKIMAFICALAIAFSLAACSKNTKYAGQTVVGKVTAVKNTAITIQLGTLSEEESGAHEPPAMPDASAGGASETPPAKPEGDGSGTDQAPPEMPSDSQQGAPSGKPGGGQTFTAGEETLTVDVSDASLVKDSETIEPSDISEGDILRITFNDKGEADRKSVV